MSLKSRHTLFALMMLLSANFIFAGNPSFIHWDMESCVSHPDFGTNQNYDEFIPHVFNAEGCTQLQMLNPTLYREDPSDNTHSCAPGIDGGIAMCINSYAGCFYEPGQSEALKFDVQVIPDPATGEGRISTLSFYELAPEQFSYIDGISGPNNYPTRYAITIFKNGVEVYHQADIPTTQEWTLEEYDFANNPAFTVNEVSDFSFHILPYCYIGNGYGVKAWDIDEIKVTSECGDGITIAGQLTTYQGAEEIELCVNSVGGASVSFQSTGTIAQQSTYIFTDSLGTIIALPGLGPTFDFTNAGAGVCYVYLVAYEGALIGAELDSNIADLAGCFDLSNPVIVTRNMAMSGSISVNGETDVQFCGDATNFVVNPTVEGNEGAFNYWILTDGAYHVISINAGLPYDFSSLNSTNFIYHLSTSDATIVPEVGDNLFTMSGCYGLSNAISINVYNTSPSTISINGQTDIELCGDQTAALDVTVTGGVGGAVYLITDTQGVILESQPSNTLDLTGIDFTNCSIYVIRTAGNLQNFGIGQSIFDIQGCYSLSNPINVTKADVAASSISTNGATSVELCLTPGDSFLVDIQSTGGAGQNAMWIITDEQGNILDTPAGNPPFDFANAGTGVCLVYQYYFDESIQGAVIGGNISTISGCYARSNGITVRRNEVAAGTISTEDGTGTYTVCAGETTAFSPILTGNSGSTSQWLITDSEGNLLEVYNTTPLIFANIQLPVCYVYHLSSHGSPGLAIGEPVTNLTGCSDLSNPILIDKTSVQSQGISIDGQTTITVCLGSNNAVYDVVPSGELFGTSVLYLITDAEGNILETQEETSFNFNNAGAGTCQIWQLVSTGSLAGAIAGNNVSDLEGCYDLSNPITIVRENVDGGVLSSPTPAICLDSDQSTSVSFSVTGVIGAQSNFVLVGSNNTILQVSASPTFDFANYGLGTYSIYHISSNGTVSGLIVGSSINTLSGCYSLSNAVQVSVDDLNPGVISSALGSEIHICGDDNSDSSVTVTVSENTGANNIWMITDINGVILELSPTSTFNFENSPVGTCVIWHLTYEDGISGANIGDNANELQGCFALSNPISVFKNEVDAGLIILDDNTFQVDICGNDVNENIVNVNLENGTASSTWLITDLSGNILDLPIGPPFDFSNYPSGTCQIFHLSYAGSITGAIIGSNTDDIQGCYDLSNQIIVNKNAVDGGAITTSLGTTIDICINEDFNSAVNVDLSGEFGPNSQWMITDAEGVILDLTSQPPFGFANAGIGTCLIWHVSYEDGLIGFGIGENASQLNGCYDLSNPITINRIESEGGVIVLADGTNEATFCTSDGLSDSFEVSLSGSVGNSIWIVSDTLGNILDIPSGNVFDFEGTTGACQIRNLSYSGFISGAVIGSNISNISGCYDFSNAISIYKNGTEAGVISGPTGTTYYACVGDGESDLVEVTHVDFFGPYTQCVVTDIEGNILDIPSDNVVDFEGADAGICNIYCITYQFGLAGVIVGNNLTDLNGCYAISNAITVIRSQSVGGTLTTDDGATEVDLCMIDGEEYTINVSLTGNSGENCAWVITDENGYITSLPSGPPFVLTGSGTSDMTGSGTSSSTCYIYNICYGDGLAGLAIDWPLSSLQGCYELSNPIEVNKNVSDAGTITTENGSNITLCTSDGVSDIVTVINSTSYGQFTEYILTDSEGNILEVTDSNVFDFEGAPLGVCYIYFVAWHGPLDGDFVGSHLDNLAGCYDISNSVAVNRVAIDGGTLTTDFGVTTFTICSGDGIADPFTTTFSGNSMGYLETWMVTDETGMILDFPDGPTFDFEGYGPLSCHLYRMTYAPGLLGLEIGENKVNLEGCYGLSNPIEVFKDYVDGGMLELETGGTALTVCSTDGLSDPVGFVVTDSAGTTCDLVVTNMAGDILNITTNGSIIDFEGSGEEDCLVYSVCYTEDINNYAVGFNISKWSTCHALSNPVVITKTCFAPEDGLVSFAMFPNPAIDVLNIDIKSIPEGHGGFILIQNMVGQEIERVAIEADQKVLQIDLSNYDAGTYMILMGSKKSEEIKRFIKIK